MERGTEYGVRSNERSRGARRGRNWVIGLTERSAWFKFGEVIHKREKSDDRLKDSGYTVTVLVLMVSVT